MAETEKTCGRCGGTGLLVLPGQGQARAELCSCMTPCPDCEGNGFLIELVDDRPLATPCRCRLQRSRAQAFNAAGLPSKYASCTLDTYKPTTSFQRQAKTLLRKFVEEFKPGNKGWLLWGPPGTGKTHLACAVLQRLTLEKGLDCRFVEFFQLLQSMRKSYDSGKSEVEVIEPLQRCAVLVVDELGKGRGSEWELSVLDQLVNHRYVNGMTCIFTSNFVPQAARQQDSGHSVQRRLQNLSSPGESLEDRLGERILSRLFEMCSIHEIDGSDFRRQAETRQ